MKQASIKFIAPILVTVFVVTAGTFYYMKIIKGMKTVLRPQSVTPTLSPYNPQIKGCVTPQGLQRYIYDDSKLSDRPFFALAMNLPIELMPQNPRDITGRGGGTVVGGVGGDAELNFFDKTIGTRYFIVALLYDPTATDTLVYIKRSIAAVKYLYSGEAKSVAFNQALEQTIITQIKSSGELVQRGFGDDACIAEFWHSNNLDKVYLVEPNVPQTLTYFEQQGVAHQPPDPDADIITSPFGLYADKLVNGVPLIMHFTWANDFAKDTIFKDKPYSTLDVLWSIRFGEVRH